MMNICRGDQGPRRGRIQSFGFCAACSCLGLATYMKTGACGSTMISVSLGIQMQMPEHSIPIPDAILDKSSLQLSDER